ncbi:hydrolase [Rhizobium sp. LC145]|jgi:FMN phosphatase YigB (HAD superfamily)|uniref:hydrolase n=1 Tax=Rhizobium sp. LC145 TaxID=1120688 RepID=UPI00062A3445|nr:hydrolase [Rhizobium sp. LC145]KKX24477.1 hydrolase [Rhizobium sp. LC145]TKT46557.1 hydrolase [Rhizobiaceae bacterium LC148]
MLRRSLDDLKRPLPHVHLITTDVFDTLLLRHGRSLRSRIVAGEEQFARFLQNAGSFIHPYELVRARLLAERFAYRALNAGCGAGEVRLADVISRQLAILGLPQALIDRRLEIEIAIEKHALFANGDLAMMLRCQREAGVKVVAVSDTGLPGGKVAELIDYFHGPGLIDRVYSSADLQASKRQGKLFLKVLEAEGVSADRVLHIGDDPSADSLVPNRMGIQAVHLPKAAFKHLLSRADGALTETIRQAKRRVARRNSIPPIGDPVSFGRSVFGPIVAEFCLLLWLYFQQAASDRNSAIVFCARGGIGIREAFERFQASFGLSLPIKRENILISRLIAARAAIGMRSSVVLDELAREFGGASFAAVGNALGGGRYDFPAIWRQKFEAGRFFALLDTDAGRDVDQDIRSQNDLLKIHLQQIADEAKRIILCDTGLYGSTQRLLSAGLPDRDLETVQFARCNYKGLSEDHFSKVAGLVVEDRFYNPFKVRTVVLRYWQIIESLFEPTVPSVNYLSMAEDGTVVGNCGEIGYGKLDPAKGNPLLAGALQYIDELRSGANILREADCAWLRLKQAIINPTEEDMVVLGVGPRSVDFGRPDLVPIVGQAQQASIGHQLIAVKSHLWREGAIARDFPRLKPALLRAVEMAHVLRSVSARINL